METYVILGSWTAQGIAKVKKAPARIAAVRKATEAVGGKMTARYLTFGRHDFLGIAEFPAPRAPPPPPPPCRRGAAGGGRPPPERTAGVFLCEPRSAAKRSKGAPAQSG